MSTPPSLPLSFVRVRQLSEKPFTNFTNVPRTLKCDFTIAGLVMFRFTHIHSGSGVVVFDLLNAVDYEGGEYGVYAIEEKHVEHISMSSGYDRTRLGVAMAIAAAVRKRFTDAGLLIDPRDEELGFLRACREAFVHGYECATPELLEHVAHQDFDRLRRLDSIIDAARATKLPAKKGALQRRLEFYSRESCAAQDMFYDTRNADRCDIAIRFHISPTCIFTDFVDSLMVSIYDFRDIEIGQIQYPPVVECRSIATISVAKRAIKTMFTGVVEATVDEALQMMPLFNELGCDDLLNQALVIVSRNCTLKDVRRMLIVAPQCNDFYRVQIQRIVLAMFEARADLKRLAKELANWRRTRAKPTKK